MKLKKHGAFLVKFVMRYADGEMSRTLMNGRTAATLSLLRRFP